MTTKQILKLHAEQHNLDWKLLYAILLNESNAQPFKNGKVISRFEPHIYSGFMSVKKGNLDRHPALPGLKKEWILLHDSNDLRKMSTSWGMAQIMCWHYPILGYDSPDDMIDAYKIEENQARSFCLFTVKYRNGRFLKALRDEDYPLISKMYNGAGYRRNNYDVKLRSNRHKVAEDEIRG